MCVLVCNSLRSTQPVTLRGRRMSGSVPLVVLRSWKLEASRAEKATAVKCSFPIRYINKSGFNFNYNSDISCFKHQPHHHCVLRLALHACLSWAVSMPFLHKGRSYISSLLSFISVEAELFIYSGLESCFIFHFWSKNVKLRPFSR
jgi:hypothetical protein